MLKFYKPYFLTLILFFSLCYCFAQESKEENLKAKYKDTLIIGIPNYNLSQLEEIKAALSSIEDIKLVYVCEEQKRFMLLLKRKNCPGVSCVEDKIKIVDSNLMVYEKTGGWNSFFSLCKGEILKP